LSRKHSLLRRLNCFRASRAFGARRPASAEAGAEQGARSCPHFPAAARRSSPAAAHAVCTRRGWHGPPRRVCQFRGPVEGHGGTGRGCPSTGPSSLQQNWARRRGPPRHLLAGERHILISIECTYIGHNIGEFQVPSSMRTWRLAASAWSTDPVCGRLEAQQELVEDTRGTATSPWLCLGKRQKRSRRIPFSRKIKGSQSHLAVGSGSGFCGVLSVFTTCSPRKPRRWRRRPPTPPHPHPHPAPPRPGKKKRARGAQSRTTRLRWQSWDLMSARFEWY
jgi:hypothetical protein